MSQFRIKNIGTACVISGLITGLAAGLATAAASAGPWFSVINGFFTGAICYAVTQLVIRKFVIYKLKPLYQVVLSKNIKTSELESRITHTDQLVSEIEGEISDWAEKNRREIAQLKKNEKYRKEYIGNVSHEMKTPIFNIQGYILTLLDGALEDPAINRTYLERAEKSIDRLVNIVTDLEEISKLESGVLKLQLEKFDLVALARGTAESVEMDAARRGIRIVVGNNPMSVPPAPVYVRADKHYISQVFINLLTNSIKYGNDGGLTRIAFIDLFDKVMVEISDNGVGITKEDIPRVFERFYRTDKSRSREQGGTGLGLSIVKHIMEAHNESITLRSEPGKGSTFSFSLSKA
ncbi:MAG: sensor histidine kinase [Rikenellaceae bacterium]|nr:sensor histidine kinase [Rikenellaceae bacterium]